MKPVKKISLFIFFIVLSVSCNDKKVELEKLAKVYVDLSVVEDYYNNTDSLKIKKDSVFKKYNFSEVDYKQNFLKIGADKEKWDEFYKLANTYLDTLKAELKNRQKKTE